MKKPFLAVFGLMVATLLISSHVQAWDYEGHRVANELAIASLPADFPAFVRSQAAHERLAFLGGEPDRWRNVSDLPLRHENGPDHYIDLEQLELYEMKPQALPLLRYDFVARLSMIRIAHADRFPPIDPAQNEDHTRELVGLLPWALIENYEKLKSGFSYLKALEAEGTPEEITNAQQNLLYVMGVLGHYAGDSAQPLHTTIHHHGWVSPNTNGYTTEKSIHAWIDGGYFLAAGGLNVTALQGKLRPARLMEDGGGGQQLFRSLVSFLVDQNKEVEPLYRLYKENKLSAEGALGLEGRRFLEGQLVKGGQLLGDLWYSAWRHAPEDSFLKRQLSRRNQK